MLSSCFNLFYLDEFLRYFNKFHDFVKNLITLLQFSLMNNECNIVIKVVPVINVPNITLHCNDYFNTVFTTSSI